MISDGEGEALTETVVWWGATAKARADGTWELHYDSKPEMGFEAEIRPVVFTSAFSLEDPGEARLCVGETKAPKINRRTATTRSTVPSTM